MPVADSSAGIIIPQQDHSIRTSLACKGLGSDCYTISLIARYLFFNSTHRKSVVANSLDILTS